MGKYDLATNLFEYTAKYVKACGKRSILETNVITRADTCGLKYVPKLGSDIASFSQGPLAKLFTKLDKATNYDDFTVLAHEIDFFQGSDAVKKNLIAKYIERYNKINYEYCLKNSHKPEEIIKNIFAKDLTPNEAKELCAKYKLILEEVDFETYVKKLIEQVKKDYGLEFLNIEARFRAKLSSGLGGNAGMSTNLDFMNIIYQNSPLNRVKFFNLVMHELKHAEQAALALAVNKDAYINALAQRARRIPQNAKYSITQLEKYYDKYFSEELIANIKAKYGTISEDSPLYKRGMDYIACTKNYENVGENFTETAFKQYKQQVNEKEAYYVSEQAVELYYLLKHII